MNEGESAAAVAASFGLHRSWAFQCRAAVKGRQWSSCVGFDKGQRQTRKLSLTQGASGPSVDQREEPQQYGFDFGLWTRQIVQSLVLERFDAAQLSLASIGAMLARLSLTAQKPLRHAFSHDPLAIEQWQRVTFPMIAAQARRDAAGDLLLGRIWPLGRCRARRT